MAFILVDDKYRYRIEEVIDFPKKLNNKIVQLYDDIGKGLLAQIDYFDKEQNCYFAKQVNQPFMIKVIKDTEKD